MFWKAADGTGSSERLTDVAFFPFSVSPDGSRLVGAIEQAETDFDVVEVSLDGDPALRPLVVGPYIQLYPQISPSGKWLAYHSYESVRNNEDGQGGPRPKGATVGQATRSQDEEEGTCPIRSRREGVLRALQLGLRGSDDPPPALR